MKYIHLFFLFFITSCSNGKIDILLDSNNVFFEIKQDKNTVRIICKHEDIKKIKKI